MGFLSPKPPKPDPAPNPQILATEAESDSDPIAARRGSLISTSAQGLKRKAKTQRTSLIGGG